MAYNQIHGNITAIVWTYRLLNHKHITTCLECGFTRSAQQYKTGGVFLMGDITPEIEHGLSVNDLPHSIWNTLC
jgi:hypothetical protein